MRIGIPKEKNEKETRVAIVPVSIPKLVKLGFEVAASNCVLQSFFESTLVFTQHRQS